MIRRGKGMIKEKERGRYRGEERRGKSARRETEREREERGEVRRD